MRDRKQHRNREVVYPQVPRVFHNGVEGTFMEPATHSRYFAAVASNRDEATSWVLPSPGEPAVADEAVAQALSVRYEARIEEQLRAAAAALSPRDIAAAGNGTGKAESVSVWLRADPDKKEFAPIAEFFGIWHEARRGAHRGLHELQLGRTHVFVVNIHPKLSTNGGISADGRCESVGCDPKGQFPCCSSGGWCGMTPQHCTCKGCVDYRQAAMAAPRGYSHLLPKGAPVLRAQDFAGLPRPPRLPPPSQLKVGL